MDHAKYFVSILQQLLTVLIKKNRPVVNTFQTSICHERIWEKKTQQLQKDVRFLNQQKKRTEAKIKILFRNNKVSLSGDIDETLNDALMSSKSGFHRNSPKHLLWEQQRKEC